MFYEPSFILAYGHFPGQPVPHVLARLQACLLDVMVSGLNGIQDVSYAGLHKPSVYVHWSGHIVAAPGDPSNN